MSRGLFIAMLFVIGALGLTLLMEPPPGVYAAKPTSTPVPTPTDIYITPDPTDNSIGLTIIVLYPTPTPPPTLPMDLAGSWGDSQINAASEDLLASIDTQLEDIVIPGVTYYQDQYYQGHGQYWQGLSTHSSPPADGAAAFPDQWFYSPTDQATSWGDVTLLAYTPMIYSLTMDVYSAPAGDGWRLCADLIIGGVIMERCINHGPLNGVAPSWVEK